jgi:NAD(P)-dependent dehydrogenase (short-subunit alcohol dehydrogenase family)
LDILVNNAGIVQFAAFEDLTEEQWDSVLATNLKGQFLCGQQAVKLMGQGRANYQYRLDCFRRSGCWFFSCGSLHCFQGGSCGLNRKYGFGFGQKRD